MRRTNRHLPSAQRAPKKDESNELAPDVLSFFKSVQAGCLASAASAAPATASMNMDGAAVKACASSKPSLDSDVFSHSAPRAAGAQSPLSFLHREQSTAGASNQSMDPVLGESYPSPAAASLPHWASTSLPRDGHQYVQHARVSNLTPSPVSTLLAPAFDPRSTALPPPSHASRPRPVYGTKVSAPPSGYTSRQGVQPSYAAVPTMPAVPVDADRVQSAQVTEFFNMFKTGHPISSAAPRPPAHLAHVAPPSGPSLWGDSRGLIPIVGSSLGGAHPVLPTPSGAQLPVQSEGISQTGSLGPHPANVATTGTPNPHLPSLTRY